MVLFDWTESRIKFDSNKINIYFNVIFIIIFFSFL